jgi:hypothetical protein
MGVALLALVFSFGGGAYAAISATVAKPIVVCVHGHGGGLYMARHCARRDRQLRFSPSGANTTAGPQGAPEPREQREPGNGWIAGDGGTAGPECPTGTVILSGGAGIVDAGGVTLANIAAINYSAPVPLGNGWEGQAYRTLANPYVNSSYGLEVYAVCLTS